jgi:dihydrofolate reductase
MINIIAAMSQNRVIGKNGSLPWKLPEDMSHFVKVTKGYSVVMGRKTFESIGRPLKNRTNIILTRDGDYKKEGCLVYNDIEKIISDFGKENLMIIGGEEIYRQFLPYVDRIYLTFIDKDFDGDTFFPEFEDIGWVKDSEEKGIKNKENPYDYYFRVYLKKK